MHEYALAERIVEAVLTHLALPETPRGKLTRVQVVAGRLHGIMPEYMLPTYAALVEGTPAAGSVLEIVDQPVTCRCETCGWRGPVEPPLFVCGACGGGALEMLTGKEFHLAQLEIETDEHP